MKILKLFEIFVIVCLFMNYANSIKVKESPVKYTQATCKYYHKECADFKDIIHPEHSVSMTRDELLSWLINANPNVLEEQLIKFIDHLIKQGSVLILPDNVAKPKLGKNGDENGVDIDIITKFRLTELVTNQNNNSPNQTDTEIKENENTSDSIKKEEEKNSNPSVENKNNNSSDNGTVTSNIASVEKTTTSNSDIEKANSGSTDKNTNAGSDKTNTNSESSNTQSGSNASSNNVKATSDIPTEIKNLINKIPVSSLNKNNVNLSNIEPAQNEYYDSNYIPIVIQSSSNSSSNTSTTSSTPTETIEDSNDVQQQDFNQDRDARGWLYQGSLGAVFISEGVVRCGNDNISIYLLVPKNLSYDSAKFIVPLKGDLLLFWNSSQINCYSNTIDIPLIEVASENEVIEESSKNRLCCLGRIVKLDDGTEEFIRTRYYELSEKKTMGCDATTWAPLYTNRFKIQDLSNPGMNSCYCGVLGG